MRIPDNEARLHMRHLRVLPLAFLLFPAITHAQPTPPAPIRILGEPGAGFGWQVAPVGDIDGDGSTSLIVGAPSQATNTAFTGRVYVFRAPLAGTLGPQAASHTISTRGFGQNLGFSVAAAGDVDGNGVGDIVMGSRGYDFPEIQSGRVSLFLGPVTGHVALNAQATVLGTAFEEIGRSVASAGDLNGDGFDDVLIGTSIGGPGDEGRVYVFEGPVSGNLSITNADATIVGPVAGDGLGSSIVAAGDLNGDGFGDVVVGAPRTIALGNTNGPGQVFVFHGPLSGTVSAGSAAAVLTGELANDNFGISVAVGDVSGDGVTDLVVGADQLFRDDGTGKAYVFHGPLAGSISASSANAVLLGTALDDLFGSSVAVADLDADGDGDVVVGAPGALLASGRAYAFRAPLTGAIPAASATFVATGGSGDELGRSVCAADVDADGRPDPVFGAPAASSGGIGYVAAYPDALRIKRPVLLR